MVSPSAEVNKSNTLPPEISKIISGISQFAENPHEAEASLRESLGALIIDGLTQQEFKAVLEQAGISYTDHAKEINEITKGTFNSLSAFLGINKDIYSEDSYRNHQAELLAKHREFAENIEPEIGETFDRLYDYKTAKAAEVAKVHDELAKYFELPAGVKIAKLDCKFTDTPIVKAEFAGVKTSYYVTGKLQFDINPEFEVSFVGILNDKKKLYLNEHRPAYTPEKAKDVLEKFKDMASRVPRRSPKEK